MPGHVIRQLDTVRRLIMGCQYLLLASVSALLVVYVLRFCVSKVEPDLPVSDFVWTTLLLPSAFLGCVAGTMVGRVIFRGLGGLFKTKFGLSRWYHPVFMFKDWVLLSLVIAGLYIASLYVLRQQFPSIDQPARTLRPWLMTRAPILFSVAFFSLLFLDIFRVIQRGAVLPRGGVRVFALPLLAALIVAPTLKIHLLLADYVHARPDLSTVEGLAWAGLVVSVLCYALLLGLAWMINRFRLKARLPVDVTLAMVGTSKVGKTVFLTRAYTLLENYSYGGFAIQPSPESKAAIRKYKSLMEDSRVWPSGTVDASTIPFSLKEYGRVKVNFSWIDLPGGVFEDAISYEREDQIQPFALPGRDDPPDEGTVLTKDVPEVEDTYREQREQFREQLKKANAIVMLFDAKQLMKAQALEQYAHYSEHREVVDEFYRLIDETEREEDTVAVTIIVAKSDLIRSRYERRRIQSMMQPLADYWVSSARARGCRRPKVRIFLSSAVSNVIYSGVSEDEEPRLPVKPKPLQSKNCVETLFWTAAQVLRDQPIMFDDAKVFFFGRSAIHQLAIDLEDAST